MRKLNNKDKRQVIDRIAKDVLLTDDRLSHDLYCMGHEYTKVLDTYQLPVWMKTFAELGSSFTDKDTEDKFHSMKLVRLSVIALANTLELTKFEPQTRLSYDSPVDLVGRYKARVSRRCDLSPVQTTLDAAQAMSRFPFTTDERVADDLLAYRLTLPYDDQEAFLPRRLMEEWGHIMGTIWFILWNILDEQCRSYANSRGTLAPMYDKVSRATACHAESLRVTKDDMEYFAKYLQREFKFSGVVDKWCSDIIEDTSGYLKAGGNPMCIRAAYAWFDACKTNQSNYILYIDAAASGLGNIYARAGHPNTDRMVNINHPGYEHPYMILAKALRNVDIQNLRGADLETVRDEIAKPTANPAQYGGTEKAVASKIMDLEHDGFSWMLGKDIVKEPKIPTLLADAFKGIEDPLEICDRMVTLCKPYSRVFRKCFSPITGENKAAQEDWKAGMDANGLPNPLISALGYVNQPTPFTRMRLVRPQDIVHASWYEGDKRIRNNYPAFRLKLSTHGTQSLAKKIHLDDASCKDLCCTNLAFNHGIDSIWIHDCGGTHICHSRTMNAEYTKAFETVHGIKLSKGAELLR